MPWSSWKGKLNSKVRGLIHFNFATFDKTMVLAKSIIFESKRESNGGPIYVNGQLDRTKSFSHYLLVSKKRSSQTVHFSGK